ncbi:hypothetical protein [Actinomadura kijaniata]|uniref:hypothetical protein n=1 Tax=Actinomadura kijaniata TaxID=46161 RepID=UPI00082C5C49|nr:hypothetical protein [Actinomadura kijaniata]
MRPVIGMVGAALLGLGGAGLGLGLADGTAREAVLRPEAFRHVVTHEWFWPVVAGACETAGLLGAIWLAGQCRDALGRRRALMGGRARRLARACGRDLRRETLELPGVAAAHVRLTGTRSRPRLRMTVLCAPDTRVNALRAALVEGPLERRRAELALPGLVTVLTFRFTDPPPRPRG